MIYMTLQLSYLEFVPNIVDCVSLLEQMGIWILERKFGFSFINRQLHQLQQTKQHRKFVIL